MNHPFVHVRTVVEFEDLVLIGGSGARGEGASAIQAVDARTGEERWYQWLDGAAGGVPVGGVRIMSIVATPKLIFAVTDTGLAAALEPTTGEILWQAFVGAGGAQAGRVELGVGNQGATVFVAYGGMESGAYLGDIGLSVADEAVLVTTNNWGGRIAALTAERGEEIWEQEITPEAAPEPSLLAYDPVSGDLRWRAGFVDPLPAPGDVGDGAVYVASGEQTVALELVDGSERWRSNAAGALPAVAVQQGVPGFKPPTTILFAGDTVLFMKSTIFVAGADMITALDPADGSTRWCAPVGAAYYLTASSGILFAGTPEGVFAMDAATGVPLWIARPWTQRGGTSWLYPDASPGSLYLREWMHVVAYDL
jgi:outer membrane protein assembly factor BamB